jgi:Dyp-type peroxidase family
MDDAIAPVDPAVAAHDPDLELDDIQGDILIGLQKKIECFLFFEIKNVIAFNDLFSRMLLGQVTPSTETLQNEAVLAHHKRRHLLPIVGLNIGFTAEGLRCLGVDTSAMDPAFHAGAMVRAKDLNDPTDAIGKPRTWKTEFVDDMIHAALLITGPSAHLVNSHADRAIATLGHSIAVIYRENGHVRPGRQDGHEHFGYLDGVSQPGIRGLTQRQNPDDPTQGLPGQDLLWPGTFVFGYPAQQSANAEQPGPEPAMAYPWMRNGAYMVFRRLNQLVPEFHTFATQQAVSMGVDPTLLEARLVGRWKSGAPLLLAPMQDDATLGGDELRNNDFSYSSDPQQRACPYAGHIRKAYPRDDLGDEGPIQIRRIRRSGIPFGPEVDETEASTKKERGLMFVCYQTSITEQFEFVQKSWCNDPAFVVGKKRPNGDPVQPGFDPLIGQANNNGDRTRRMDEPRPNYPVGNTRSVLVEQNDFIVPTAGAYLFMPSISALQSLLQPQPPGN